MKATWTKTKDAGPLGVYVPTAVDARKATTDFRLTAVCPNYIVWNDGRSERVTDQHLEKLQAKHTWATDF